MSASSKPFHHPRYLPPCASDLTFADTVRIYILHLLTYLLTYLLTDDDNDNNNNINSSSSNSCSSSRRRHPSNHSSRPTSSNIIRQNMSPKCITFL